MEICRVAKLAKSGLWVLCSHDYTARTGAENRVVEISHSHDYGSIIVMTTLL